MLEELQRRNFAANTIQSYLRVVEEFSHYFGKPPDRLGRAHLREYQAYLLHERRLQPSSVRYDVAALRFFFV